MLSQALIQDIFIVENSIQMQSVEPRPANRCHVCGATSYHNEIVRNRLAQLQTSSTLICDGCGRRFDSVAAWRDGLPASGDSDAL